MRGPIAWLAACAALPAAVPAHAAADPASRVTTERLGDGRYSIRPSVRTCPRHATAGRAKRLVALAEAEWIRFGRKTFDHPVEGRNPDAGLDTDQAIAGFWTSLPAAGAEPVWRTWRNDPSSGRMLHWSAAFTSWLMCEAGYGDSEFKRSMRHADYVIHALDHKDAAAHRVHGVDEHEPKEGDLLCADRSREGIKLAQIGERPPLHCFLIIKVSEGEAQLVGGNVQGAVAKVRARVENSGSGARIVPTADSRWLVLMSLRDRP